MNLCKGATHCTLHPDLLSISIIQICMAKYQYHTNTMCCIDGKVLPTLETVYEFSSFSRLAICILGGYISVSYLHILSYLCCRVFKWNQCNKIWGKSIQKKVIAKTYYHLKKGQISLLFPDIVKCFIINEKLGTIIFTLSFITTMHLKALKSDEIF